MKDSSKAPVEGKRSRSLRVVLRYRLEYAPDVVRRAGGRVSSALRRDATPDVEDVSILLVHLLETGPKPSRKRGKAREAKKGGPERRRVKRAPRKGKAVPRKRKAVSREGSDTPKNGAPIVAPPPVRTGFSDHVDQLDNATFKESARARDLRRILDVEPSAARVETDDDGTERLVIEGDTAHGR